MNKLGRLFFAGKNMSFGGSTTSSVVNPPTPGTGQAYKLQVKDTTETTSTIIWNSFATNADSINVYVDGQFDGNTSNSEYTIQGLVSGQTITVLIIPVVNGVEQTASNEILSTTSRTMGNQWLQVIGLTVAKHTTLALTQKSIRWSYINDKGSGTSFVGSNIMIRRYDTEDIANEDAEFLASRDYEGSRGYEVLAPQSTGQTSPDMFSYGWIVPNILGAVYRVFVAGINSAGTATKWHPGPIITEGENWKAGADIRPLWYTDNTGTGTVTLIENGVRTVQASWADAIANVNPSNFVLETDGVEVSGVVRTQSATADINCKVSGEEFKPIRVFGATGPHVDSVRASKLITGTWTSEGGGRYSTPIPADYTGVTAVSNYKPNTIWVNELPLRQVGSPSYSSDIHKDVLGYGEWDNELYYMSISNMAEQTFAVDYTNNKIWVRLPNGVDPSPYTIEAGWGTGCLSGVDKVNGSDVMRNYWHIENITFAHGNYSALFGGRREVLGTGREGWTIKNVAILGGDTRGFAHFATDTLLNNVIIDAAQAINMLSQNTGPELGWVGDTNHPDMRSLTQNVTFSASNVGQYFPANHLGLKRIPAHALYHERRCAVIPRLSTTFTDGNGDPFYLKNLGMGAWYDVPGRNVIHEECFFKDLAFGIYSEIGPAEWQFEVGDWGVDNRNITDVGFNEYYYATNSPTNNSKTLRSFLSSTQKAYIGHCTTIGGTANIFIGGGPRGINEPNFQTTTDAIDCAAHGNLLEVKTGEWCNIHVHDTSIRTSADDNYHVNEFSGSFSFYYSNDQTAFKNAGFGLRDQVGVPIYVDVANDNYQLTGGTNNALLYGSCVPAPEQIQY